MLNGEVKYKKKKSYSTYRTRAHPLVYIVVLPAAATVTTDVWLQSDPISSVFGYDVILATTNVTGAFFDGFFFAWESGIVVPSGAKTQVLHLVAEHMRAFGLSTFTSWAGMVGVAASMAHARSDFKVGIMYILLTILCAFVAHGLGSDFAKYISSPDPITNKPYSSRAHKLSQQIMIWHVGYILLSYIYLGKENIDSNPGTEFWITATPRNQLLISTLFAIAGAYSGHLLAHIISKSIKYSPIPMETLVCNALFGMLGLSLNAFKLSDVSWGESLILRGFAINFCGAASLFARHVSDNQRLYAKKRKGLLRTWINILANILFATLVFWAAFEIEQWEQPSEIRRGVMVKIMKILEKTRKKRALA